MALSRPSLPGPDDGLFPISVATELTGIGAHTLRGYERAGFFEVDTGDQRSWTVQLTETSEQSPSRPLEQFTPLIPGPTGGRHGPPVVGQPPVTTR